MKDIVKEIRGAEASGEWRKEWVYFRTKTTVSRKYFNEQVIARYPNLTFIRIFLKKTTFIPTFHESLREEEYYLYSVFIDKNVLGYLSGDGLVGNLSGEQVINLSKFGWEKQIELRNKIFRSCPIILAEFNKYYDDVDRFVGRINLKLGENISIYPYNYEIEDYELLNSTKFVLISNSSLLSQKDLDDFCLEILGKLCQENQSVIDTEKEIYLRISKKLKQNIALDQNELNIVELFLNSEMDKIERNNTLLVRSRRKE